MGGSLTTHVAGSRFTFTNDIVHSLGDSVCVIIQAEVAQKHRPGENHSTRVRLVLALDIEPDVTAAGFKYSNVATHVAARDNAWAANKGCTDIRKNSAVQIGHDHDIKLLGPGHGLHGCIVNNHIVDLQSRIVLGNLVESATEQTVGQFHDVCLVNAGDLLPVVCQGKAKGKFRDTLRFGTSDNFQRLDDTLNRLMFKARVFSLGVLTDDAKVDILMACLVARDVLDQNN